MARIGIIINCEMRTLNIDFSKTIDNVDTRNIKDLKKCQKKNI